MSVRGFFPKSQKTFGRQGIFVLLFCLMLFLPLSQVTAKKLTHEMSEEEKALMPAYLKSLESRIQSAPPPVPLRNIAEFETMEGVLIAYPLGIPVSLVAQMSQDVMVTTIVDGATKENQARNLYSSNGVNMANCNFLYAPHDSYWTRDYGPWFVTEGNGTISIMDFTYNRPRPDDNNIPSAMATFLGVDLYQMDLIHAGGNYMTDAWGISVSTDLVWEENPTKTPAQINQIVNDYLGVHTYHVTADPLEDYIKHVDCWGKYLDVDKVLITRVPQSDSRYSNYEAVATYFTNQVSGYGNTYQVPRVYSSDGEPYTNSLILNKRVFVPIMGTANDSLAISTYQEAMPGYQIIGVTGSWESTDALHCRVIGIADRGMLYIHHQPLLGVQPEQTQYEITADIIPYSGMSLVSGSVKIYYRVDGGSLYMVTMTNAGGNTYTGYIPGQSSGSEVEYYLHAEDMSGRISEHPLIGAPDPHTFLVGTLPDPPVADFTANTTIVDAGSSVQFMDLSGNNPTAWNWTFAGGTPASSTVQNPIVTYNTAGTYDVTLTASNAGGSDTETKVGYITVNPPAIVYCTSSGTSQAYEWIAMVQAADINNPSGASGYTDFTGIVGHLTRGSGASVSLTPGYSGSSRTEYWRIWIDYNHDGDFADTGEQVFSKRGKNTQSSTFTVPTSALTGTTRMRVSMRYGSYPVSCGTFSYGEVEDYTVNIN